MAEEVEVLVGVTVEVVSSRVVSSVLSDPAAVINDISDEIDIVDFEPDAVVDDVTTIAVALMLAGTLVYAVFVTGVAQDGDISVEVPLLKVFEAPYSEGVGAEPEGVYPLSIVPTCTVVVVLAMGYGGTGMESEGVCAVGFDST